MAYSDFTIEQVIEQFELDVQEQQPIIESQPVTPSALLVQILERELPWAIAVGSEIARYSGIIAQVLLEVRALRQQQISVFAGKEFNVNPVQKLNGYCDFLVSLSPVQSVIQAPVAIVAEAKRGILENGLGQCVAGMVAAQQFNQKHKLEIPLVYGSVTDGSKWKFVKLQAQQLTIDVTEYDIVPVERLLGILMMMTAPLNTAVK
ncbi:MAG: hypothetical protein KME42_26120 [Tildeniella nuda ZEHNDER 1965/U140]|jgi:hypothetical protein|nr:hypothetical protein [Tildeniella nuda ZEHNDER 1965/U140]